MIEKDAFLGEQIERREMDLDVTCIKITDGLNFGDGAISVEDRIDEEHQHAIDTDTISKVHEAINSPEIIVPIDTDTGGSPIDDDGCGDGRGVKTVFRKVGDSLDYMKRSLHRYKAFGGGLMMGSVALIGMGKAEDMSLHETVSSSKDFLKRKRVPFGAHTDDHAHGDNCGCGAIDRAPLIIENSVRFRENITQAVGVLTGDTTGLERVYDEFESYAGQIAGQDYSGRKVMDTIVDDGKIVKELEGPHLEIAIVINTVEGYTVNQEYIRQISNDKAQVFAVDVPRLQKISESMFDDSKEQHEAFLSMLVYTLATAATLTKGDLPVFAISADK
jgi:hypothetical protein